MDELRDSLRRALEQVPGVQLAILFGSRARGSARPDSDVDIAILPVDPSLTLRDEHEFATILERAAGAPVDLVRLDHARPALKWRIARDGLVLMSKPPQLAARFLASAGIEHDELRELELDAMRRYRARIAAGTPESVR